MPGPVTSTPIQDGEAADPGAAAPAAAAPGSSGPANAVAGPTGAEARPAAGQRDGPDRTQAADAAAPAMSPPLHLSSALLSVSAQLPPQGHGGSAVSHAQQATPATSGVAISEQYTPSSAVISVRQAAGGGQRVAVHLHPAELGVVRVQIERGAGGTVHLSISAERPQTLDLLQRDQAALIRSLDHAGVPSDGRTLSFHTTTSPASHATGGAGGRDPTTDGDDSRGAPSGRGQDQRPTSRRQVSTAGQQVAEAVGDAWHRIGLDITA